MSCDNKAGLAISTTLTLLAAAYVSGCTINNPRIKSHNTQGWRHDNTENPSLPKTHPTRASAQNDDMYKVCTWNYRTNSEICMCKTGRTDSQGKPIRMDCRHIEQQKKERSPYHVIKYRRQNR